MAINFPATPNDGDTHEGYVWVAAESAWRRLPEAPSMDIENLNNVSVTTPADGESLVYDSATGEWINADATVEVYGVDTAATDYFMIPVGGSADRPGTPAIGHVRFNSDIGEPEWYSQSLGSWVTFRESPSFQIEYLVIAGGGSGATGESSLRGGGGGGAGGYRSSFASETSGGNSATESPLSLTGPFTLTIGAGGAGTVSYGSGTPGSDSVFASITSSGGGQGGPAGVSGGNGGSGGGSGDTQISLTGSGTTGQGFRGGYGENSGSYGGGGGGGGGAGSVGSNGASSVGGSGGSGLPSSITGSSIVRSPGGKGGNRSAGAGSAASANTGGGGGGGGGANSPQAAGGAGGSGIIVLKYPSYITLNPDVGHVYSTTLAGEYKITTFTAGTGTVTLS